MIEETILKILRPLVLITGFMDAYKYKLMAQKVARLKASGQISRTFLVWSILSRIVLLAYVWLAFHDKILITTCIIALYTMLEAFYYTYLYYPYRNRGLKNFKRPSIWAFIKDTLSFKNTRKRL